MKSIKFLFFVFLFSLSCNSLNSSGKNNVEDSNIKSLNNQQKPLLGTWVSKDSSNWIPRLQFNKNNTAIFYPIGDTVLNFAYKVQNSQLILESLDKQTLINDSIISLNDSILILNTVAGIHGKKEYKRISD